MVFFTLHPVQTKTEKLRKNKSWLEVPSNNHMHCQSCIIFPMFSIFWYLTNSLSKSLTFTESQPFASRLAHTFPALVKSFWDNSLNRLDSLKSVWQHHLTTFHFLELEVKCTTSENLQLSAVWQLVTLYRAMFDADTENLYCVNGRSPEIVTDSISL